MGGWIHWEEQPELAVKSIDVVRGGASDLYGSSAIGGVMNVGLLRPSSTLAQLRSSYGMLGTYDTACWLQTKHRALGSCWAAGGSLGTDGYIQEAPWQRGPVDINSNVHAQNGLLLLEHRPADCGCSRAEAVSTKPAPTALPTRSTAHGCGAMRPAATGRARATAPWRCGFMARLKHYRQTFSSISNLPKFGDPTCSYRCGETPSRFALIPDNELGAAAHWSQPLGAGLLAAGRRRCARCAGVGSRTDVRRHRRADQSLRSPARLRYAMASCCGRTGLDRGRLRPRGLVPELRWAASGSGTEPAWTPAATQPPQLEQTVFDPRLGVSRKLGTHWAVSASGFRAFRAPTPSELYRSTQVGNQLTKPNGLLQSERATGWETGVASQWSWGTIRASYFLTQINRPISAVTINPTSSPILLLRENLGQIESQGISLDFGLAPQRWLALMADTSMPTPLSRAAAIDLGNWIPEVARNMATLNRARIQAANRHPQPAKPAERPPVR